MANEWDVLHSHHQRVTSAGREGKGTGMVAVLGLGFLGYKCPLE